MARESDLALGDHCGPRDRDSDGFYRLCGSARPVRGDGGGAVMGPGVRDGGRVRGRCLFATGVERAHGI